MARWKYRLLGKALPEPVLCEVDWRPRPQNVAARKENLLQIDNTFPLIQNWHHFVHFCRRNFQLLPTSGSRCPSSKSRRKCPDPGSRKFRPRAPFDQLPAAKIVFSWPKIPPFCWPRQVSPLWRNWARLGRVIRPENYFRMTFREIDSRLGLVLLQVYRDREL